MMDAPERIGANTAVWGNGEPLAGEWNHRDVGLTDDTPFIRADLCADPELMAEAVEVLRELVAAQHPEAGEMARKLSLQDARAFIAKLENRHDDN